MPYQHYLNVVSPVMKHLARFIMYVSYVTVQ